MVGEKLWSLSRWICYSRWLSSAATAFRTQLVSASENSVTTGQDAETQPNILPTAPSSHESPSFMHDPLAQKFINCMMWDGKKSLSQRIFREALEVVKRKLRVHVLYIQPSIILSGHVLVCMEIYQTAKLSSGCDLQDLLSVQPCACLLSTKGAHIMVIETVVLIVFSKLGAENFSIKSVHGHVKISCILEHSTSSH